MSNEDIQLTRHSARSFTDKPVATALLKQIVTEAQHAPSWENAQPWRVYLATGDTAKRLREANAKATDQQQKGWYEVTPPQTWAEKPQANIDHWLNDMAASMPNAMQAFGSAGRELYHAPVIAYITIPKNATNYSAYDAGAFGYGLLLAAAAHGVNSIPAAAFIRYPNQIRNEFDIPEDEAILLGIGLGYASDEPINSFKTKRVPLADMLQIRD